MVCALKGLDLSQTNLFLVCVADILEVHFVFFALKSLVQMQTNFSFGLCGRKFYLCILFCLCAEEFSS